MHKSINHTTYTAFLKVDQPLVNFQHKPNNTDFEALTLVNHKDSTCTKDLFVKHTLISGLDTPTNHHFCASLEYCSNTAPLRVTRGHESQATSADPLELQLANKTRADT